MIDQFMTWFKSREEEINHISSLLSEEISNEPEELIGDLTAIEAWNSRCSELFAESNNWLEKSRKYFMPERGEGTEVDRKITMEKMTADIKQVRDRLDGLSDAIKTRITLGQSILAYKRQFIEQDRFIKTKERIY